MPIKIIGKSIFGEQGFIPESSPLGDSLYESTVKIAKALPIPQEVRTITMTSAKIDSVAEDSIPIIRTGNYDIIFPTIIHSRCKNNPNFIIWDSNGECGICATTFSKDAPILAFESDTGKKCLGVISRTSLWKYGEWLFSSIKEELGGNITVTLVTCNHFNFLEGSTPSFILNLSAKYDMHCIIGKNSEKDSECCSKKDFGYHIVALW